MTTELVGTPDPAKLGPAMLALNEMRRRFVMAYAGGAVSGAEAARQAGYSDAADRCRITASELLHRTDVLAAIREVTLDTMRGEGVRVSMNALLTIASNSEADDDHRIKASIAVLDRVGVPAHSQHSVHVEHTDTRSTSDLVAVLQDFVDRKRVQVQEVIDVTPEGE